jgi:D-apiose dehydrogenase
MSKKIALVGLGAAGRHIHLPAYRGLTKVQVVAACDIGPVALPGGIALFGNLEELLAAVTPDIMVIATPTASHFEIAQQALNRNIHVLCEKPFATTVEEASQLVRLARERGVKIAVNNEFRFMKCHAAAKALIGSPEFGELQFVHMHQSFRANAETEAGWRGSDPERTCKEFGTHVFDLCRYFFGAEPLRMNARMPKPGRAGGPDMLNLIDLEFPGDRYARITLDRLTRGRHRYLDIRLDGTEGCVETELGGRLALSAGLNTSTRRPFFDVDVSFGGRAMVWQGERRHCIARDPTDLFVNATRSLMRQFITALDNGTEPACNGSDNLRTLALMRTAYEAAASRREVSLGFLNELP